MGSHLRNFVVLVTLAVGLIAVQRASGQLERETISSIKGMVTEQNSCEPLQGCSVALLGTTRGAVTDAGGNYEIRYVLPGLYSIEFSYVGFKRLRIDTVNVGSASPVMVDVALEEARPLSSDNIHQEVIQLAISDADSDLARGRVLLITPDSITDEEKAFAREHGFQFKQVEQSLLYYHYYNGTVHKYLTRRFGDAFMSQLDSLWTWHHPAGK